MMMMMMMMMTCTLFRHFYCTVAMWFDNFASDVNYGVN